MASGVKLSKEWASFLKAMDGNRLTARLARTLPRAAERVGRDFVRLARAGIRAKDYAPNSPITVILKGSSTPLVDRGDLFQSITYQVVDPYTVRLGILRAVSGAALVNLGLVLHEGATINVREHPKVRRKVWATVRERLGPDRMASLNKRQAVAVKSAAEKIGISVRGKSSRRKMMAYLFASGKIPKGDTPKASDIWIIPARPFLARPAQSAEFQRSITKHYSDAIESAFKGF